MDKIEVLTQAKENEKQKVKKIIPCDPVSILLIH